MQAFYIFFFLLTFLVKNSISQENENNVALEIKDLMYNLVIKTKEEHFDDNGDSKVFEGDLSITFEVVKGNKNIFLLDASSSMKMKKILINDKSADYTRKNDKLEIVNNSTTNKFHLTINYEAPFGKNMTGIYRSSYKTKENKNKWIITSHFEPIFARNAFPCFDDPKKKAIFNLSVEVPKSIGKYQVLSNTECKNEPKTLYEADTTFTTFKCDSTLKMSTYLLAFTISDFPCTKEKIIQKKTQKIDNNEISNELKLQTCAQSDMINYGGELAQDVAEEAVKQLQLYLKVPYSLAKIHQVGIPDFSAGAMENWGLILFRESKLIFNKNRDSILTKQSVILTIIHELVHQWFGNLVTLESWDYIWLNEAFATYLQYLIADKFTIANPKIQTWKLLEQQVVNEIHLRAFETDGLKSSKSMTHHIKNESLIFSFFNDINYSKGSAVLRMWDLNLKQEKFKLSLNKYLIARQFNSATPEHLFEILKAEGNMSEKFFYTWTKNPGYPVVNVKKEGKKYVLTQNRFLFEDSNDTTLYEIPITYYTNLNSVSEVKFLSEKTTEIPADKEEWIIINNNQSGYYRVNYEESNWNALAAALNKNLLTISELNRAQIVNDIFSLARSNQKEYVKYETALSLAMFLENESSSIVWKTALHSFDFLRTKLFDDRELNKYFENYLLKIIEPNFKNLTSLKEENENHIEVLKGIEMARWACSLGHKKCTDEAIKIYKEDKIKLPNTEDIILCTAVRLEKDAFKNVLEKYLKETDNIYKNIYLNALGCSNDQDLVNQLLNKSINGHLGFRKQDLIYVMSSVTNGNMNNIKTVFKFIQTNYIKIAETYGGIDPLGRALVGIAKKLNSEADLDEFDKLVKSVKSNDKTKSSSENADIALNIVRNNVNWIKEKKQGIYKYFKNSSSFVSYSIGLLAACLIFIFNF